MTKNYSVLYKDCVLYSTTSLLDACHFVINYAAERKLEFWVQEKLYGGRIHYTYYDKNDNYYTFTIIKD